MMFPARGIDVSCEFGRQPKRTSPEAENVRAFEPGDDRARGGSRPGLVKFLNDMVSGSNEIQHICLLVTAGVANLQVGVTPPIDIADFVLDPSDGARNPGRLVPLGGDAVMLNRNLPDNGDDPRPNWFAGEVSSGSHPNYFVDLTAAGTVTATTVRGTNIAVGTPVLLIKEHTTFDYFMQPNLWFS